MITVILVVPPENGVPVVAKCANRSCSTSHAQDEGRLFRLDIDIGNAAGETERKTAWVWLCTACARQMSPKVSVDGDTVRLALTCRKAAACRGYSVPRVN